MSAVCVVSGFFVGRIGIWITRLIVGATGVWLMPAVIGRRGLVGGTLCGVCGGRGRGDDGRGVDASAYLRGS